MRIVIWGTGGTARLFCSQKIFLRHDEILAFVNNDEVTWGTAFMDKFPIVSPQKVKNMNFEQIVICSLYHEEIRKQLTDILNVPREKIILYSEKCNEIINDIVLHNQFDEDVEIQDILNHYILHGFNIYGKYTGKDETVYQVYYDDDNMPYILFLGKKMYYPMNYSFPLQNGRPVVIGLLNEQQKNSPHLYIKNETDIPDHSVIVDAGVCEGNFALRFVESAKHMYLIESDPRWFSALKKTFFPYRDKVTLCNKRLSRYDTGEMVTLDSLVNENIDFLKMDIEGDEINALLGGKRTLKSSEAHCAICSYHRRNDEENIRFILEACGYYTSCSKGYMFFTLDDDIVDSMDFRRGIVYGEKNRCFPMDDS